MLAALKTALGQDFGLSRMPGFSETGDFPIYFTGPTGQTFNYSDAHSRWHGAPQIYWLATAFNRPAWAQNQQHHANDRPAPLDLLWGADWLARQEQPHDLSLARHFAGVSVVFLRSAWNDPQATFVGFKGGDNRVNHGQLDLGTFVLDALGERWFSDLGPDNYNLPGYFGPGRWNFYRNRAEGHNTLVVSPSTGPDQNLQAKAKIVTFKSEPNRSLAIADLSAAYSNSLERARRGIALLNRRDVLVQDEIAADKPNEVWWFAHTTATVSLDSAKRVATLQQNGKTVYATLAEPASAAFELMDASPLATSPRVEGQADESRDLHPVRKLAIHIAGQTDSRIAVLISLTQEAAAAIQPLDHW